MNTVLEAPVKPSVIQTELQKNNVTDAIIAQLKEESSLLVIDGLSDKKGYEAVDEHRKKAKSLRVLASKLCVKGREDAVKIQREWIAVEKDVCSKIEAVEIECDNKLQVVKDEKERIRLDAERKERERIQSRVKTLIDLGASFDGLKYSIGEAALSESDINTFNDEQFNNNVGLMLAEAEKIEAARIENERLRIEAEAKAESERLAEVERMRKEREELEALRKQQEEREAAIRAEQKKIADEQAARELEIRKQQEEIDRQNREAEATKQRESLAKETEARIVREREESARIAAEVERRRIEEEARESERKALAAIEEEKRLAAIAPDKDKLLVFSASLAELLIPTCQAEAAIKVTDDIRAMVAKMHAHISQKVKSL